MSGVDFLQWSEHVERYVANELQTLRANRAATWPEYTQFMWRTDKGWESWVKSDAGQEVIKQLGHDAWRHCFCAAFDQLLERIEKLEQQIAETKEQ